jgi:hypothetical protein
MASSVPTWKLLLPVYTGCRHFPSPLDTVRLRSVAFCRCSAVITQISSEDPRIDRSRCPSLPPAGSVGSVGRLRNPPLLSGMSFNRLREKWAENSSASTHHEFIMWSPQGRAREAARSTRNPHVTLDISCPSGPPAPQSHDFNSHQTDWALGICYSKNPEAESM